MCALLLRCIIPYVPLQGLVLTRRFDIPNNIDNDAAMKRKVATVIKTLGTEARSQIKKDVSNEHPAFSSYFFISLISLPARQGRAHQGVEGHQGPKTDHGQCSVPSTPRRAGREHRAPLRRRFPSHA